MRERDDWRRRLAAESAGERDENGGGGHRETGGGGDGTDPMMERVAERLAAPLRAPERADPTFKARVMASVHAESHRHRAGDVPGAAPATAATAASRRATAADVDGAARDPWLRRGVRVTPLGGLAAAAAIAGAAFLGGRATAVSPIAEPVSPVAASATTAAATRPGGVPSAASDTVRVVQFVFVAPGARRVSLVGDFNGWDREATRLQRGGARGLWTVAVALPAGRHEYAFVVDGTRWEADPAAPASAVTDDFGVVTSVVSVDGPSRPGAS